jgi:hypothetical protein
MERKIEAQKRKNYHNNRDGFTNRLTPSEAIDHEKSIVEIEFTLLMA